MITVLKINEKEKTAALFNENDQPLNCPFQPGVYGVVRGLSGDKPEHIPKVCGAWCALFEYIPNEIVVQRCCKRSIEGADDLKTVFI